MRSNAILTYRSLLLIALISITNALPMTGGKSDVGSTNIPVEPIIYDPGVGAKYPPRLARRHGDDGDDGDEDMPTMA